MTADTHQNYVAPADLLTGRVILVTGASAGIGREAALQYARHGATVVLLGRQVSALETLYDEILSTGGSEPAIYPLDLSGASPHDYDELASRLTKALEGVDGILLNAAMLGTIAPVEFSDAEEFVQVMHTNVTSSFLLVRALLPHLKTREDAAVLLTTSGVGRKGRAFWGAYAVSKFATEGLMQVLADECSDTGVRVNCVNPGAVRTKMRATAFPAEDPNTLVEPAAVMPTYLWLMGPDSHHVRGQSLNAQAPKP
ncbi:MAG: YciK family oxidoreductase [Gammaproteobacteria bacterium]|nr:YciK family oxidoreductase [Gammaproteobacteria bacterium]